MRNRSDRLRAWARTTALLPIALPVVAIVRIALMCVGYPSLTAWLPHSAGHRPSPWVDAIARAVHRTARLVPGATCLTQAVAVRLLLASIGHQSWIRIGVRRDDDGCFKAHAWLLDGRNRIVIGGSRAELAGFRPLADLQGPDRP